MVNSLGQGLGASALGLLLVLGSVTGGSAQSATESAISVDEASLAAVDKLALAGQLDEATQTYRKMLVAAGDGPFAPRLADRLAQIANRAGKMEEVYATLKPIVGGAAWQNQIASLKDRTLEMLGDAAGQTGRQDEALAYARQLADFRSATFRPESLEAQVSQLTVAAMLDKPETEAEAKRIRDGALDKIQKVAPEQQYLDILNNITLIAQNAKRFETAGPLYDRLIAGHRARPESFELGLVELNAAILHRDSGAYDEAVRHHLQAIEILERQAGPKSADTIAALSGLGRTYSFAGRPAAAVPLLRDAYARAEQALGATGETMARAENLAEVLRVLGSFAEAERLDRKVLEWKLANLGPADESTLTVRKSLALDLIGLEPGGGQERIRHDHCGAGSDLRQGRAAYGRVPQIGASDCRADRSGTGRQRGAGQSARRCRSNRRQRAVGEFDGGHCGEEGRQ